MTLENINPEPLKVKNWNSEKEEKRIDYFLSIVEDKKWFHLGFEIDQSGNVEFIEKYNCDMP